MTENLKFGSKISEVSYEPYNDTAGISWAWHPKLRTLINQPINTIAQYAVFSTVMSWIWQGNRNTRKRKLNSVSSITWVTISWVNQSWSKITSAAGIRVKSQSEWTKKSLIQAPRLLATLNTESTNRLKTKDKVRSHHLIHSLLDQILCDFNLFLIPSDTYSSFSQCNTLWRMLGYQLQKNSKFSST